MDSLINALYVATLESILKEIGRIANNNLRTDQEKIIRIAAIINEYDEQKKGGTNG